MSKSWGLLAPRFAIKANPQNSVFSIAVKIPSAIQKVKACRTFRNPVILAQELRDEMQRDGITRTELARRHSVSRVRIHQWLSLLRLPKLEVIRIQAMGDHWERRLLTERMLRNRLTEADCEE